MLQQRLLLLILVTHSAWHVKVSARLNHLNSPSELATDMSTATDSKAATYAKPQRQSWQSSATHNNWIILQAATAAAAANTREGAEANQRRSTSHTANGYDDATAPLQRLPVNYYAYNHSAGNYQSPGPDVRVAAPYVLAISSRRHTSSSANNNKLPPGNMNPGSNYNELQSAHLSHYNTRQDIRNNGNNGENDNRHSNVAANDVIIDDANTIDSNSLEEQQLNEVLQPLGNALDKVKRFCDILKHIISDADDADSDSNDLATDAATNARSQAAMPAVADVTADADVNALPTLTGQGRQSTVATTTTATATTSARQSLAPSAATFRWPAAATATATARSSTTSTLSSTAAASTSSSVGSGRGKKFKKKLKKLILPLLIAYKLKFLTLVPVMIGGLTLLVGTTGLAGFFFALFTAVMSLKSGGGSKSIIVKRVHD